MSASEFGPWDPLNLETAIATFETAPFRWWVAGGHALDLHLQRSWREHEDTDIGILRNDLPVVFAHLDQWDVHVAAAGRLRPWNGETLHRERHENNLWCRATTTGPWFLDVMIGEGDDNRWMFRRDPSVQLPWERAVLHATDGVPYLAPELQLLYKSSGLRPKDDIDAAEVIPMLSAHQREYLARHLDHPHPWRSLVA